MFKQGAHLSKDKSFGGSTFSEITPRAPELLSRSLLVSIQTEQMGVKIESATTRLDSNRRCRPRVQAVMKGVQAICQTQAEPNSRVEVLVWT